MAGIAYLALAAASAGSSAHCADNDAANRALVTRFYTTALVDRHVRKAFEADVARNFVEHKPDIATADRAGAIAFLEQLIAELPLARWELLRVTGSGDLFAIHARFTPAPGAPAYAIADFFRVHKCKIVEHWDVVAPPPKQAPNPLSRF